MTDFHFYHFLMLLAIVLLSWKLPRQWQFPGVSLASNLFLLFISPWGALSLLVSASLVYVISNYRKNQYIWVFFGVAYCAIQFLLISYLQTSVLSDNLKLLSVLGLAYFSCRNIHYLMEAYKGKIINNLRDYWYYQSFLPVMVTGPINRYPDFVRELQRRHFNPQQASLAIERIIYGYAKVVILGNYIIINKIDGKIKNLDEYPFLQAWLSSLNDWAYLYIQFSGWSDIAIGFALLMGIKINENFNYPFLAKSIIDFWQRWHISLSSWCKDYVFIPMLAITRNPFFAISAAMVVMGIWHELSTYYFIWGIYHASGIACCRLFQKFSPAFIQPIVETRLWTGFTWLLTLNFIVAGALVIQAIDNWIHLYV